MTAAPSTSRVERHPVVEKALKKSGGDSFVANDANLGPEADEDIGHIWLITGPNMAGKSTFLRQNALIAVMAQGVDMCRQQQPISAWSTVVLPRRRGRRSCARPIHLHVEMVETAAILNQAGDRSLVILDEIGRGTATFDGLSIAWATIEHLHEVNRSRALFATHYTN